MAEVVRPRLHFSGAGAAIEFPVRSADDDSGDATAVAAESTSQSAYLVTPAAHIGRVVTGVVLLAPPTRLLSSEFAAPAASAVDRFGLAAVSFADKLAEQGYKVLVADVWTLGDAPRQLRAAEQAALFLRQHHDVQRAAICGVGAGADLALRLAIERPTLFDCAVAMDPTGGQQQWTRSADDASPAPMLVLVGGKSAYASSAQFHEMHETFAPGSGSLGSAVLRSRVFPLQDEGFAFSYITDEDAATQAIAEILDWLLAHLHRFRVAAGTSDGDPWWPQGRNGPFFNVGLKTWQDTRTQWITETQARPPAPPPVPSHLLFDGLSSVRRTFELPQRMRLGDVIELFVEIWDVQQ